MCLTLVRTPPGYGQMLKYWGHTSGVILVVEKVNLARVCMIFFFLLRNTQIESKASKIPARERMPPGKGQTPDAGGRHG